MPEKLGLYPGKMGEFDDSGVMPSSVVRINTNKIYLYYIGWNLGVTVPLEIQSDLLLVTIMVKHFLNYLMDLLWIGPI